MSGADAPAPWRIAFDNARDPYTARNALGAEAVGAGGGGGGGGAPSDAEYIVAATDATLTNERVLTNTATITWDFTTPGQAKASTAAGGGNVSNSGTPTIGQYAKWVTATTIQGVAPATVLSDIGAQPAGSYQPLDADLTSIAAYAGTATWLYRSAADTWSPVTISTGLTFTSGVLAATGVQVGFDVTTAVNATLSNNNLTATHSAATANSGVRVGVYLSVGKYYFEIKKIVGGTGDVLGLCAAANTYNQVLTGNASVIFVAMVNGNINVASVASGNIAAFAVNDVAGFAIDLTAGLVWIRKNAGNWNGSGTANPATATGGVAFAAGLALAPVVGFGSGASGEQYTANFGATSYANAAPSGFNNWPTISSYQPLDATLTALAAYNTNGLLTQTAADTFTGRSIAVPAAGITITNANGVSGNPTLALADDLAALEALTGTNTIYYRSGSSAWSAVTFSGLTFSGGVLTATAGGAPANAEYITSSANATLSAERVLTNTATITWDFATAGQAKANAVAGGGNVSNSGTPTAGQYAKWVTATTVQGVNAATVPADIGAPALAGNNVFTGTNKIPTILADTSDTVLFKNSAAAAAPSVSIGLWPAQPGIDIASASGTDGFYIATADSGPFAFWTSGGLQLLVNHTASADRYVIATGSSGGNPTISASAGRLNLVDPILTGTTTVWTVFSPALSATTGTFTSATASGRYTQIGKSVHFLVLISVTTNGTAAGTVRVTLPVTAQAALFSFVGRDSATGTALIAFMNSTSQLSIQKMSDGSYPAVNGSTLIISGSYEAA